MIGRRRKEGASGALSLVTHADVRAACGLRGVGILDVRVVERRVYSFDAALF